MQPADQSADHFRVFGLERRVDIDRELLERRYKELTRTLHPDRFARADARARKNSLQRTVQLNDAWRVLREPARRAEYLLRLEGIDVADEKRRTVPPAQLMEMMELREGLAEARAAGDAARVQAMAAEVRARRDQALAVAARSLPPGARELERAAAALVAVRYYDRYLEEVTAFEEAGEVAHA